MEDRRSPDGGSSDTLVISAGFDLPDGVDSATFVYSEHLGEALPTGAGDYRQQVGVGVEHLILEGDADHDALGDSSDNRLTGNAGDNLLYGDGGDDTLSGGAGEDHLHGGSGRDRLDGGTGADLLEGRSGVDELHGGDGDDILDGGGGGDRLYGEAGNDSFLLGLNDSAIDTVFDHEGANRLTLEDGAGHEVQTAVAGDELYLVVDKNPVAVVDDYLGSAGAFDGVDIGGELRSIDDLMASRGPALGGTASASAPGFQADDDLLGTYLTRPSLNGTAGSDHLVGTSSSDWLHGAAGDDHLVGAGGLDVLEGGAGNDLLEGGAGADRYLFKSGEAGWSVIRDTEGANVMELDGFAAAHLRGVVVGGQNLVVVADNNPLFTFENFVGNEQAFAGVQVGEQVFSAEDLLDG
jgi:Ca2+-binding RTX toxin-like protein